MTPLAKGWITARARTVTAEAMNVRGGNGYVEEWVNARLLRDSHLGAIWEGTTGIVALDVQRAILREDCYLPLFDFVRERLATVSEPAAKPWVDVAAEHLATVERTVERWRVSDKADRELEARPVADTLYPLLAASLLLAEGQVLWEASHNSRKLLVAALYLRRWLGRPAPGAPLFTRRELDWLDPLLDWEPLPATALPPVANRG